MAKCTEPARRFARAHNPAQNPPFALREWLIVLLLGALWLLTNNTPGLLSDLGRIALFDPETSWQVGIGLRLLVAAMAIWVLLGVREMAGLTRLAHLGIVVELSLRMAEIRITHEPLTVAFLVLLITFALFIVRTAIRPNDTERIGALEQENRELKARLQGRDQ